MLIFLALTFLIVRWKLDSVLSHLGINESTLIEYNDIENMVSLKCYYFVLIDVNYKIETFEFTKLFRSLVKEPPINIKS